MSTMDMRQAVNESLRLHGLDLFSTPQKFVGYLSSLADTDSVEMVALNCCCDRGFLAAFATVGNPNPSYIESSFVRSSDYLMRSYAFDMATAQITCAQIALGICDYFNVPPSANLQRFSMLRLGSSMDRLKSVGGYPIAQPDQWSSGVSASSHVGASAPPQVVMTPDKMGWDSTNHAPAPVENEAVHEKSNAGLLGALVGTALALVILLVAVVVLRTEKVSAVSDDHAIKLYIEAPGLDENGSRIPVHIEGTTADDRAIDEVSYVDSDGYGVQLEAGTYEVTIVASPISSDGTMYEPSRTKLHLEIPENAEGEFVVPAEAAIVLEPMPHKEASKDYLDQSFLWLDRDMEREGQAEHLKKLAREAYEE